MQISKDDEGSLILKIHGGLEILSDEDEAELLALLMDRAGGAHNLALEADMAGWGYASWPLSPPPPTTGVQIAP